MWFPGRYTLLLSSLAPFLGLALAAPTSLLERAEISILSTAQVSFIYNSLIKFDDLTYSGRHLHSLQHFCKRILLLSIPHPGLEL